MTVEGIASIVFGISTIILGIATMWQSHTLRRHSPELHQQRQFASKLFLQTPSDFARFISPS